MDSIGMYYMHKQSQNSAKCLFTHMQIFVSIHANIDIHICCFSV